MTDTITEEVQKDRQESILTEAVALSRLVELAAWKQKYGTFAERNPTLGKMIACPFCGQRKRQNDPTVCCNPRYVPGTENEKTKPTVKRKNPRLTRNNPPLFEVHQILVELESKPNFKEYDGLSGVVEASISRRKKAKAKSKRGQQKRSRKMNRH